MKTLLPYERYKEGSIVARDGAFFLIVKSDRLTFTGKHAYGLVDLKSGTYSNLEMSKEPLAELCKKARLEFVSPNLNLFIKRKSLDD